MPRNPRLTAATIALALFLASTASGHYLWVAVETKTGEHGVANIYFEEGPAPGDGHYLDHFTDQSKTWVRTVLAPKPKLVTAADTKQGELRWLQAKLPAAAPRSVDCYGKFGVYAYGKTNVLLHYYARYLDITTHGELHELARAEQMQLDMKPHDDEQDFEITVLWRGKPVPNRLVSVRGPKKFRVNKRTNEKGVVRFPLGEAGRYTFRTSVEQKQAGQDGDAKYSLIRHHATLTMRLPLEQ